MNYKIEKNTVQETLIIPLYARKICSELYPNQYREETQDQQAHTETSPTSNQSNETLLVADDFITTEKQLLKKINKNIHNLLIFVYTFVKIILVIKCYILEMN